jgi:cytochrome c oxidase cbb3-type subunit 3
MLAKIPDAAALLVGTSALFVAVALAPGVSAQERNPLANDPAAIKAGESEFRINCSFCHGIGARGGGRGPDLTRIHKKHGNTDADLFRTISSGVPGTDMPAAMGSIGVEMKDQEIWQVISYLRSIQAKIPPPTGDAAHGKVLFEGVANCSKCHMVEGKGGRLGPDLTSTGSSRSIQAIVESVREPSKELVPGYQSVTVVTADGQEVKGIVLNEDLFSLQMMDTGERIRLFEKDQLRSVNKSPVSLMPPYNRRALSDHDLQDIVGYLVNVSDK